MISKLEELFRTKLYKWKFIHSNKILFYNNKSSELLLYTNYTGNNDYYITITIWRTQYNGIREFN